MTEHNDVAAKPKPIVVSLGAPLRVCFMPPRDTSLRSFVRGVLFSAVYATASTLLFYYFFFRMHGVWFYAVLLGQLILHFYLTTEFLISNDEVERLAGYGLMRSEGVVRFCGYAPGRRRLRTLGLPIRFVEEADSAVLVYLSDGSHVGLPKLSLGGQRLFKLVFESMSAGADAEALRAQHKRLAPGLLVKLEYREAPQLPRWQYWVSMILAAPGVYVGWKLHELLFR